jgi:6-phosphogluconolactonase
LGDERCVPPDDPRSNARMAHKALLDHVPVRRGQIHPIDGETAPDAAAATYERLLHRELADSGGRLDLVFLGLGEDGHTASLFPGSSLPADTARWVAGVQADGRETARVTMTPALINAARMVVFLVMGKAKASILEAVLSDTAVHRQLPARLIRPQPGRLIWMVDRKAASPLLRLHRITKPSHSHFDDTEEEGT